jgi:copper homeostasis protein (lipoprotein)
VKKLHLLALACLVTLAAAGCKPHEPAEPAEPAVAPVVTEEAPKVAEAVPTGVSSADAPTFDQKGFAGTFKGSLPCADCPGIDATLELKPDGSFQLSEVHQTKAAANSKIDGTWTVEAGDKQIRLDPNSKAEQDRLFAIASNEQIDVLGADGKPGNVAQSLKRETATQ